MKQMRANDFKTALCKAVQADIDAVDGKLKSGEWSVGMYPILTRIGEDADYAVRHKDHGGEINKLDFCHFRHENGDRKWFPPSVIVEHENVRTVDATWQDFWKCCIHAAPLRVYLGYAGSGNVVHDNEEIAWKAGEKLIKWFDECGLPRLVDGEAFLIMGWKHGVRVPGSANKPRFHWHALTLKGLEGDWRRDKKIGSDTPA